jgi:hypothetical protein
MTRIRLPYVYADTDRYQNVRYYYWRGRGPPKFRLPGSRGSDEFMAAYHACLTGQALPNSARCSSGSSQSLTPSRCADRASSICTAATSKGWTSKPTSPGNRSWSSFTSCRSQGPTAKKSVMDRSQIVSVRSGGYGAASVLPRQEFVDPGYRMVGDFGEDGAQIGFRIDAVELGGLDQGQDAGGTLAALVRSGEQPVLAPDGYRPD